MMQGVVNLRREAKLTIVVGSSNQQLQAIETVIDTGFTGFLSLPPAIITTLNLPWSASESLHWEMEAKRCLICTLQL